MSLDCKKSPLNRSILMAESARNWAVAMCGEVVVDGKEIKEAFRHPMSGEFGVGSD